MSTIRTFGRAAGAVGVAGALVLVATPASAADTATVSILHAVPDTPVDVYANGEELLADFQPGTLTDPLELPAGTYDLAVYPAGVRPGVHRAGHLGRRRRRCPRAPTPPSSPTSARTAPRSSRRSSTTSPRSPAGEARVTVRHTAAAPAVDIRAGGTVVAPAWPTRTRPR